MNIIIAKDYDEASRISADIISGIVQNKPNCVIGLATGSTPIGLYDYMSKDHKEKGISYAGVKTVNLDEYVGLDANHDQSYAYFMNYHLFSKLDIDKANTNLPCGIAPDIRAECDRYNNLLSTLVPDVQVLGIGSNGHIGFNEPGTPFNSVTQLVNLTESTIKDNSRLFANVDEVPKQAFSMGISNIMSAKKILMLAFGKNKAKAVKGMIEGEITPALPASVLQMHNDVTVILDPDSASLLENK